jgi:cytochrome c oxidase assembly protein subunit 15
MEASTLALLGLKAVLVALVPLGMVYISSDANKYRKLVWAIAFLTFDLIVFGAYTRLTDSGLGCPDWPGCYGEANPFIAHESIRAAETLMPTGPVTVFKAWVEMIHRYVAMAVGFLIIALLFSAIREWRKTRRPEFSPTLPWILLVAVCIQGAFGAWTVTLKLQPVIVTIHLLLGMSLLALLVWVGCRQDHALLRPCPTASASGQGDGIGRLARFAFVFLFIQIALGGWVSTNYATLACDGWPLCSGQLAPEMDFDHGFQLWRELGKTAAGHYLPFQALVAIHWVHRNFAWLVFGVMALLVWRGWTFPILRKYLRLIAIVLAIQAFTGIATVFLDFPLTIAALHNAGAAILVVLVTMVNYKAKHQLQAV